MPTRVSPTDRIRRHIDDLFAEDRPLPEILEGVARLGAQLLMQAALEAEVTEFLGRDRYARAALAEDARPGSRNGYREVTVKSTAGPVALARPKLRGTTEAFASRLFGSHVTKTNALESLVIASFIRGLSVRDVEATLADALGDQAAISKSTVSKKSCQASADSPVPGARPQAGVKDAYWAIFDTEDLKTPPGPKLVELIDARISEMTARYGATYPSAMKCLTTDAGGLTAYLRFPAEHHKRIRHSNFIERTFGETRRRVKVIGRLPGETSCLTLVWAVLDRASRGWRGFTMTAAGPRQLQDLRRSLLDPPAPLRPRTVTTAQIADGPETVRATA